MLFASLPSMASRCCCCCLVKVFTFVVCSWLCCGLSQAKEESERSKIADKMIAIKTVLRLMSLRSSFVSLGHEFFKLFIVYQHTRARECAKACQRGGGNGNLIKNLSNRYFAALQHPLLMPTTGGGKRRPAAGKSKQFN